MWYLRASCHDRRVKGKQTPKAPSLDAQRANSYLVSKTSEHQLPPSDPCSTSRYASEDE